MIYFAISHSAMLGSVVPLALFVMVACSSFRKTDQVELVSGASQNSERFLSSKPRLSLCLHLLT